MTEPQPDQVLGADLPVAGTQQQHLVLLRESADRLSAGLNLGVEIEQLFYERNGDGDGITVQVFGANGNGQILAQALSILTACSTTVLQAGKVVARAEAPRVQLDLPDGFQIGRRSEQDWPDKVQVRWAADAILSELGFSESRTTASLDETLRNVEALIRDEDQLRLPHAKIEDGQIVVSIQNNLTDIGAAWLHSFLIRAGAAVADSSPPISVKWQLGPEAFYQAVAAEGSFLTIASPVEYDYVENRIFVNLDPSSSRVDVSPEDLSARLAFRTGLSATVTIADIESFGEVTHRIMADTNWRGYSLREAEFEVDRVHKALIRSPFRNLLDARAVQLQGNQIVISCNALQLPDHVFDRMTAQLQKSLYEFPLPIVFVKAADAVDIAPASKEGLLRELLTLYSNRELVLPEVVSTTVGPRVVLRNDHLNRDNPSIHQLNDLLRALGAPAADFELKPQDQRAIIDQELNTAKSWSYSLHGNTVAIRIDGGSRSVTEDQRLQIQTRMGAESVYVVEERALANSIEIGGGKRWRQTNADQTEELCTALKFALPREFNALLEEMHILGNRIVVPCQVDTLPARCLERASEDLKFFSMPVVLQFRGRPNPCTEAECTTLLERSLPPNVYLRELKLDGNNLRVKVADLNTTPTSLDQVASELKQALKLKVISIDCWDLFPEVKTALADHSEQFCRVAIRCIDEIGEITDFGKFKDMYKKVYEAEWPKIQASLRHSETPVLLDLTERSYIRIEDDPLRTLDADDAQFCTRLRNGNILLSVASARLDNLVSAGSVAEQRILRAKRSCYAEPGEIVGAHLPNLWLGISNHLLSDLVTTGASFSSHDPRPALLLDIEIDPRKGIVNITPLSGRIQIPPERTLSTARASAQMQDSFNPHTGEQLSLLREAGEILARTNENISAASHRLPLAASAIRTIMLTADEEVRKLLQASEVLWDSNGLPGAPSKRQLAELKREFCTLIPQARGVSKGLREAACLPVQHLLSAHIRGDFEPNLRWHVDKLAFAIRPQDTRPQLEERLWIRFFETLGRVETEGGRPPIISAIDRSTGRVSLTLDTHGFRISGRLGGNMIFGQDPTTKQPHVSVKDAKYRAHQGMTVGSPVLHIMRIEASILHPDVSFII